MSQNSDFDCKIEIKQDMNCLQSLCSYFMESKNKKVANYDDKQSAADEEMIKNKETDLCNKYQIISNVGGGRDLKKSISDTEKSISEMNICSGTFAQIPNNNNPSFFYFQTMEPVLEIDTPTEDKIFFDENDEPPIKRVKFTNNNIVCDKFFIDQNTQTHHNNDTITSVKKMINRKIQTEDVEKIKPPAVTYCNAMSQTDDETNNSGDKVIQQHVPVEALSTIEEIKTIIDNRRKRVSSLSSSIQEARYFFFFFMLSQQVS